MKIILLTFILSIIMLDLQAQDDDGMKTMISKGTQINGYGSLDVSLSNFNESPTLLVGAQGGILLDHHFYVGLAGYGLATRNQFSGITDGENYRMYGGYGGLVLGAVVAPVQMIHLYIPVIFGAGSFDITDPDFILGGFPREVTIESSACFILEPGLQAEVNITNFFRLGLGATYRFVEGAELTQTTNQALSSWSGQISFRFGRF